MIQLTTDAPHWGGLSGATPGEAKSWGKLKTSETNHVVVYSCASITFPIICQYALETCAAKPIKALYDRKDTFTRELIESSRQNASLRRNYAAVGSDTPKHED